jgi:hypothetical protein
VLSLYRELMVLPLLRAITQGMRMKKMKVKKRAEREILEGVESKGDMRKQNSK